ncbi:MAG: hypothetical protein ABGY24_10865 [bacterium]
MCLHRGSHRGFSWRGACARGQQGRFLLDKRRRWVKRDAKAQGDHIVYLGF